MTSKERVFTTLKGGIPDRVPFLTLGIDPKFIRILGDGSLQKTYEVLGLDVYPIYCQNWCQGVPLSASLTRDVPEEMQTSGGMFGGWEGVDEFGRLWKRGSYIGGAVRTEENMDQSVPALRLEERMDPARTRKNMERDPDKAFALMSHTGPFGLTMESMGFMDFFYAYVENRGFVENLLWKRTKWFAEIAHYAAELGADFILMGDDVAFKGRTFISPEDFEAFVVPCFQYIVKRAGIPVVWHTDGYITPLLDCAVKAGFAGVHSLEPTAGVDLGQVKRGYGDRLVLAGNVDCAEVLCQNDLQIVRKDVERCMDQAKAGGRYILSDSNSIHAGCHPEAVVEMFRYAREIGGY